VKYGTSDPELTQKIVYAVFAKKGWTPSQVDATDKRQLEDILEVWVAQEQNKPKPGGP